jgi:ribosomal protein S18 acetylase RimI-like enzyme
MTIVARPLRADDRPWFKATLDAHWGSQQMVSRGALWNALDDPGFVAWRGAERAGIITYRVEGAACEIRVLVSVIAGIGAGTALIAAVENAARAAGCARVWLITTNDNLHALGFYQKRGYEIAAVYRRALDESRRLKPQIPLIGLDGIPLRDEIELEKRLSSPDRDENNKR